MGAGGSGKIGNHSPLFLNRKAWAGGVVSRQKGKINAGTRAWTMRQMIVFLNQRQRQSLNRLLKNDLGMSIELPDAKMDEMYVVYHSGAPVKVFNEQDVEIGSIALFEVIKL